jgi:hypothetical protein
VKPGDLVKTTRARIGIPAGTCGLIVKSKPSRQDYSVQIYLVDLVGSKFVGVSRPFLNIDLEVINESR